jgi:hypothetical protein
MTRKTKLFKYDSTIYKLQSLYPADFLEYSVFPFQHYILRDEVEKKEKKEVKRNWKIRPKKEVDLEEKLKQAMNQVFIKGIVSPAVNISGIFGQTSLQNIEKNKELYEGLFSSIYALTFSLTSKQMLFGAQISISRDYARSIYTQCKTFNLEPYSLMANIQEEKPEIYNPKRHTFNLFIRGEGFEQEREETEEATKEMEKRYQK